MCDFLGCGEDSVVTVQCPHYNELRCPNHCDIQRCEVHQRTHPAELESARYVARCWHAPRVVNPTAAPEHMMCREILEAGMRSFGTEHTVIVVRKEGDRYTTSLGVGSHQIHLKGSFSTTAEAFNHARTEQQRLIREELESIQQARGGTLDWGIDVTPKDPKVIYREGAGSAWEGLRDG